MTRRKDVLVKLQQRCDSSNVTVTKHAARARAEENHRAVYNHWIRLLDWWIETKNHFLHFQNYETYLPVGLVAWCII